MARPSVLDSVRSLIVFPFQDPAWARKLGIATALTFANFLLPILPGMIVSGYMARLMKTPTEEGAEARLPEWDDWGGMLAGGARLFVVGFIYLLLPLAMIAAACVFLFWFSLYEPRRMITDWTFIARVYGGVAGFFGLLALSLLVMCAILMFLPVALAHVVASNRFGAAFELRQLWRILRANAGGYVGAWVLILGLTTVLNMVFAILYYSVVFTCFSPLFLVPIGVYSLLLAYTIIGEAYRGGIERLEVVGSPVEA